jgi:hypothetical protein
VDGRVDVGGEVLGEETLVAIELFVNPVQKTLIINVMHKED